MLPTFGGTPEIIIPNDKLQWLIDHPDNEASVAAAHYDGLFGDYAFTDPYLLQTVFHEHVTHKNLARKLTALIPHTWDEVVFQLDGKLGLDTEEWQAIPTMETFMKIVAAVSNRMFVGLPLCRNQAFLDLGGKFANDVGLVTALLPFAPKVLRPILGPLLTIPNHWHARQIRKYTFPAVTECLTDIEYNATNPAQPRPIADDYITWHINQAKLEGKTKELEPEMICKFLLPVEFAAIHTTTFTIVNVLLDLMGSDPKHGYLEGIRSEASLIHKETHGVWTKQALTKMVHADSAIRESMRVSAFMTRAVTRKVINRNGLKSEDEGWTAPYGSLISLNLWTRHHDPDIYPDPYTYDAFRFSRLAEAKETYLDAARPSFISTGDTFLPFGHGRHACPGRFFINQELKLMLAHLLMRYDVQYLEKRPDNSFLGSAVLPPAGAKMKVRRRRDELVEDFSIIEHHEGCS